jgi:hypothetical protein
MSISEGPDASPLSPARAGRPYGDTISPVLEAPWNDPQVHACPLKTSIRRYGLGPPWQAP